MHMAVQERLLRLVGVGDVHQPARVREPQREHPQLQVDLVDPGHELPEVDLALSARRVLLADRDQPVRGGDLSADPADQRPDRGLGQPRVALIDQPLPDPAGRVPLPTRRGQVLHQPRPDLGLLQPQHRTVRERDLTRRWRRVPQRQTHHPTVHLMTLSQRPDRQPVHL